MAKRTKEKIEETFAENDLKLLDEIPKSFFEMYGNIEMYLLESDEVFPPVIDGFKHFGNCQKGFYYINQ